MRAANLDPEDPTVRTAVFGEQVQEFLKSEVGDFVLNRCRQRIERLTADLKKADPFQPVEIVAIQAELRVLEGFAAWLGEAVQAGVTAMAMIEGEQDADDT